MADESVVVFLRAQIGEFTDKMKTAEHDAQSLGAKGGSAFQQFGKLSTGVLLGAGAAAVAFGTVAVRAALQGEQAHARLSTAIKDAGQNEDDYKDKSEATSAKMATYGFTNDEVENSIARLTIATHDTNKAIGLQSLAADIARASNIDLGSATNILVQAEAGRYRGLQKLGVQTKDVNGKTLSLDQILKNASNTLKGQAQASADTFAGKLRALGAETHNFEESVGNVLIPVILKLVTAGVGVIAWLRNANDATGGWIGKLSLLAVGAVLVGAAIIKLIQGVQGLVVLMKVGAANISSFVETLQIWALLNPTLAIGMGAVVVAAAAVIGVVIALGQAQHRTAEEAKNLTDAVLNQGKTFAKATEDEITAYITKHADLIDILNKAGVSVVDLSNAVSGSQQDYDRVTGALLEYGRAHRDEIVNGRDVLGITQSLIQKLGDERGGLDKARKSVDAHREATQQLTAAKKDQVDEQHASAESAAQEKAAQDALVASLQKLNDLTIQAAGGQLALDNATLAVGDATQSYLDKAKAAIDAKGKDAAANRAEEEAHNALRQSILDAASAAATDAKNHVDLTSKATGTALALAEERAKHAAIARELDVLLITYPGLRGEIEKYRQELGLIPAHVNTQASLNLHVSANGQSASVSIGSLRLFAEGGVLGPGQLGIAGEAGAEIIEGLPGGGARIVSHRKSLAAVGGSTLSRVGGGAAPIFVFEGVLDSRDAERRFVKLLADYRLRNNKFPWESRN